MRRLVHAVLGRSFEASHRAYIGEVRHREACTPVAVLSSKSATSRLSCP